MKVDGAVLFEGRNSEGGPSHKKRGNQYQLCENRQKERALNNEKLLLVSSWSVDLRQRGESDLPEGEDV